MDSKWKGEWYVAGLVESRGPVLDFRSDPVAAISGCSLPYVSIGRRRLCWRPLNVVYIIITFTWLAVLGLSSLLRGMILFCVISCYVCYIMLCYVKR